MFYEELTPLRTLARLKGSVNDTQALLYPVTSYSKQILRVGLFRLASFMCHGGVKVGSHSEIFHRTNDSSPSQSGRIPSSTVYP